MKFDPVVFIKLAQRNGITLTRIDGNIRAKNITPEWGQAIRKHKRQLLKHLPEDKETRLQLDIFYDT